MARPAGASSCPPALWVAAPEAEPQPAPLYSRHASPLSELLAHVRAAGRLSEITTLKEAPATGLIKTEYQSALMNQMKQEGRMIATSPSLGHCHTIVKEFIAAKPLRCAIKAPRLWGKAIAHISCSI